MPTYSSDSSEPRYGPAGFAAMAANMFVLEFLTWVLVPAWFLLPATVLPVVIVNALVAFGLTKVRSATATAQVGRGMLIACASAPLTVIVFALAVVVANAVGSL